MKQMNWICIVILWLGCSSITLAQTDQLRRIVFVAQAHAELPQQNADKSTAPLDAQREEQAQQILPKFARQAIVSVADAPPAKYESAPTNRQTERRTVGKELDVWVSKTEQGLVPAADAMPEEKYGFAPSAGKFEGVRTFAEQIKHLTATNYILASAVLGEKPPHQEHDESAPDSLKSKAEIMGYLKGSFGYLHRAAAAINEGNEAETIKSMDDRTRPGLIVDALLHSFNHYGQIVEYLRMNGIVPPASR